MLSEFDLVFPAGTTGRVVHHIRQPRLVSGFSLSVWVQARSTRHGVTISLVDSELQPVWSLADFGLVRMAGRLGIHVEQGRCCK